jgi:uncharacterized protein YndB with AHSA1/START domain
VTRQDLGNETTTLVADGADLVLERVFDAPRELVWTALTSPEHIPQWWGPHGTTPTVVEMDVRPGGRWRWIAAASDGGGAPFAGEYLEVVPPERIVRTVIFDVEPFNAGPAAVETTTLEDLAGRTRVRGHTRFPSAEVLGGALATGMSRGALESYDRLAHLLTELA